MTYRHSMQSPAFTADPEAIERSMAELAFANSIADAAGWEAFIADRFSETNASGLSADTRALLQVFFTEMVTVET